MFTVAVIAVSCPSDVVPLLAGALVVSVGVGLWLRHHLGGLTGDVYGAAIELSELVFLIVASIRRTL